MIISLIVNGFVAIGQLLLNIVYGREWVAMTKEKDPQTLKQQSSKAMLIILAGVVIGAVIMSQWGVYGCGTGLIIIVFAIWTVCVRKQKKENHS